MALIVKCLCDELNNCDGDIINNIFTCIYMYVFINSINQLPVIELQILVTTYCNATAIIIQFSIFFYLSFKILNNGLEFYHAFYTQDKVHEIRYNML